MKKLKQLFILPFLIALVIASGHALFSIIAGNGSLAWWSVIVACGPMLGFMIYLAKADVVATSRNMPVQLVASITGAAMAIVAFDLVPSLYTLIIGFIGTLLYIFWYSRLSRTESVALAVGKELPEFEFFDHNGAVVNSRTFIGGPTIYLFYRGSWCPLCVAHVKATAEEYQNLDQLGVQTVLLSPQSQEDTRRIAEEFSVPFIFGFDKELSAARQLGIVHEYGVPPGLGGANGAHTVFPTVVITDSTGKIIWLDQTDNYRVRAEPALFLNALQDCF